MDLGLGDFMFVFLSFLISLSSISLIHSYLFFYASYARNILFFTAATTSLLFKYNGLRLGSSAGLLIIFCFLSGFGR